MSRTRSSTPRSPATLDGGIKYFGADASKPYPNPADGSFATGAAPASQYTSGATFPDAGATGIPRYPTNIYYNVSTNAQEVDEYQTLYDSPTCVPITGVTTCNPAGTPFTIAQILASVDQGMFQHMMGNDPRPDYFHQTNLMSQTTGTVNGEGNGLFYETLNPLLAQYNQYFASNAPIEQLTMAQIGTLLTEQANWATANASQVSGYIQGNVATVNNKGAAVELPLTGTNIGSAYAGSQSGWTLAPAGTSTYTALSAWPAPPTGAGHRHGAEGPRAENGWGAAGSGPQAGDAELKTWGVEDPRLRGVPGAPHQGAHQARQQGNGIAEMQGAEAQVLCRQVHAEGLQADRQSHLHDQVRQSRAHRGAPTQEGPCRQPPTRSHHARDAVDRDQAAGAPGDLVARQGELDDQDLIDSHPPHGESIVGDESCTAVRDISETTVAILSAGRLT